MSMFLRGLVTVVSFALVMSAAAAVLIAPFEAVTVILVIGGLIAAVIVAVSVWDAIGRMG